MNQNTIRKGAKKSQLQRQREKKKKKKQKQTHYGWEQQTRIMPYVLDKWNEEEKRNATEWTKRAAKEIWENKCKWNNDYEFEDASAVASGAEKISRAFSSAQRNFSQYVFSGCAGFS